MEDCPLRRRMTSTTMKLQHAITLALTLFLVSAAGASEVSWMFRPGYYTHSPVTGKRVAQYEPDCPSYVSYDPTYQESGYRHETIQAGNEWVNIVQTWGAGTAIRPYGEWLYPYRAGATPYGPWGNPQGPWTLPFDSWRNPYGLNRWPSYGYGQSGNGQPGYGGGPVGWQGMPQGAPGPMFGPTPGPMGFAAPAAAPNAGSVPPPPSAQPQGQAL
jgi:hypothetical protein